MKQFALTLDLRNDPLLIEEYEEYHRAVWPEVRDNILACGILTMEIYRFGIRLFMYIETVDDFEFDKMASMNLDNPTVQNWEKLMWKFQKPLPGVPEGTKWAVMKKIFTLNDKKTD